MPNLYPTETITPSQEITEATQSEVKFGRSWKFDFSSGEFVTTPTGKIAQSTEIEAWLEWCQKSVNTDRYRSLVYSRQYGQEYEDLIGRHLTRAGNESEIKRITTECLMIDPRTAGVENFSFKWDGDAVYFTCDVISVRGETGQISGVVRI